MTPFISWGLRRDTLPERIDPAFRDRASSPWIPRGSGCAYGDAAIADHWICPVHSPAHIHHFNPQTGSIQVDGGVTLAEILAVTTKHGWIPSVLPGTQQVTVGGAIAADIHGKNHQLSGCFSRTVKSFTLLSLDEKARIVEQQEDPWFRATCGGMGLTGYIQSATLQLQSVPGAMMAVTQHDCYDMQELRDCADQNPAPYQVAWLDLTGRKQAFRFASLQNGSHIDERQKTRQRRLQSALPWGLLAPLVHDPTMRLANRLYGARQRRHHEITLPMEQFFFPLDGVKDWNRAYRRGLLQYQCVIPASAAIDGMSALLETLSASTCIPYLSVWKKFGAANSNWLSFPIAGETLTMDFPNTPEAKRLFAKFDRIVRNAGGRVYLAKDATLSQSDFDAMYPQADKLRQLRAAHQLTPIIRSELAARLAL